MAVASPPLASDPARRRALGERWELYRLLAEPMRLRLLALAAEEELAVGELAELLREGQPNVSRQVAPLRQAGLLSVRKEATRTLVRLADGAATDPVVADALVAGRSLCMEDGALVRVVEVVRAREAPSRAFFGKEARDREVPPLPFELGVHLAALAPLLPRRALAVDAGTGDGSMLDVLAPVFVRVVAFDREAAQIARCSARVAQRGYSNVELVRGELGSDAILKLVRARGHDGADVVFAARVLHHAPRPAATIAALAELLAPGGAVVVVDYARHDDESMRAQADLWLGFDPSELRRFARRAELIDVVVRPIPAFASSRESKAPDAHLPWQVLVGRRSDAPADPPRPRKPRVRKRP